MTSPGLNMWKLFLSLCCWLFSQVNDEYRPLTPSGIPSSFCTLSMSDYLQSVGERDGRRWTWEKEKAKVYFPAPPAGCCGGFLPARARCSSPSSSLPGVQDHPPPLPFQMEGDTSEDTRLCDFTGLCCVPGNPVHSKQPLYHTPRLFERIICFLPGVWYTRVLRHHTSPIKTVEDKSTITKEKGKWY